MYTITDITLPRSKMPNWLDAPLDSVISFNRNRREAGATHLERAVLNRCFYEVDGLLGEMKGWLAPLEAARCLTAAVSCPTDVFAAILDKCPESHEYAGGLFLTDENDISYEVYGTVLTLAAAADRGDIAALLLEKGWDVNSCSAQSKTALARFQPIVGCYERCDYCGQAAPVNSYIRSNGGFFGYITPLAAAIFFDAPIPAGLLLKTKSAILGDSTVLRRLSACKNKNGGIQNER